MSPSLRLRKETDQFSETLRSLVLRILGHGQSRKPPVILGYTLSSGLENRDYGRRGSAALTTRHPPSAKVGTNFADNRRSLSRYSSLGVIIIHYLQNPLESYKLQLLFTYWLNCMSLLPCVICIDWTSNVLFRPSYIWGQFC
jgi:hypothetical protein